MIVKIIQRLREYLPACNNNVFALANLEDVEKKINIDSLSLYVIHVEDRNLSELKNSNTAEVIHSIAILAVLPLHKNDERGEAAQQTLFDFRYTLNSILYGWKPLVNFSKFIYVDSRFQKISGNTAQHLYKFTTTEYIDIANFGVGSLTENDIYSINNLNYNLCNDMAQINIGLKKVNK